MKLYDATKGLSETSEDDRLVNQTFVPNDLAVLSKTMSKTMVSFKEKGGGVWKLFLHPLN